MSDAPDAPVVLQGLIGQKLLTPVLRSPNWIRDVGDTRVRVGTAGNPDGDRVPIALVQTALDEIYAGEVHSIPKEGRGAFVGAVLAALSDVEVLTNPRRARLRSEARVSPDWTFDELILALDLYMRWRPSQPPSDHPDIAALSDLLRRLPIHTGQSLPGYFRSTRNVHRRLTDFAGPDPSYSGTRPRSGRDVHLVWEAFASSSEALELTVARISASAGSAPLAPPDEAELSAVEGRILLREHRVRERDRRLVRERKERAKRKYGRLACEVCGLDFAQRYGELGSGYIEAHHTLPLTEGSVRTTTATDLALLCANCHAMIHRGSPRMLTLDQLRELLRP